MRPSVSDVNAYFDGKCILSGGAHAPSRADFGALAEISLGEKFVIAGA